jgi:hypothetical protein
VAKIKRERLEDSVVVPELSVQTMEDWHKNIAAAGGLLALTLARRRRSPKLVTNMLSLLIPVVEEMNKHA